MASVVLDSSFVLEWALERDVERERRALFESILGQPVYVPGIWLLEITNVLLSHARRGTLPMSLDKAVAIFWNLPVIVEGLSVERAWNRVLALSHKHGLSAYDGA